MPPIREILKGCSLNELRSCAYVNLMPSSGTKGELLSRLLQGLKPDKILSGLSAEQLRKLCRVYALPISGTKSALVGRLLEITTIPDSSSERKATRKKCFMCLHVYDPRAMHKHHFVPKSRSEWEGGTVLLCGNCHAIFHSRQREEEAKKGRKLSEDEIQRLSKRTRREIQAGKYGRK